MGGRSKIDVTEREIRQTGARGTVQSEAFGRRRLIGETWQVANLLSKSITQKGALFPNPVRELLCLRIDHGIERSVAALDQEKRRTLLALQVFRDVNELTRRGHLFVIEPQDYISRLQSRIGCRRVRGNATDDHALVLLDSQLLSNPRSERLDREPPF